MTDVCRDIQGGPKKNPLLFLKSANKICFGHICTTRIFIYPSGTNVRRKKNKFYLQTAWREAETVVTLVKMIE